MAEEYTLGNEQKTRKKHSSAPLIEEMESRLLMSADAAGVFASDDYSQPADEVLLDDNLEAILTTDQNDSEAEALRLELVFVDTDTPDHQKLVDDLLAERDDGRQIEVILLDNERDGIEQITNTLQFYGNVDAIHIISHGDDGTIDLGNSQLDSSSLEQYKDEFHAWNLFLSADADVLIYGCNLAATADGQTLIDQMATLTGADIAASDDLTGHESLGGDWELEYQTGSIETDIALSVSTQTTWQATLDITSGLVSHWTFDSDATDSSGTSHGTLINQASIDTTDTTDNIGEGKLSLDGNNDYVDLSSSVSNFSSMSEGTISGWVKTSSSGTQTLFSISDSASGNDYVFFGVDHGHVSFEISNSSGVLFSVSDTSTILDDGKWHHIAITVDGTGNRLYVDGIEIPETNLNYLVGDATNTEFFSSLTAPDSVNIGVREITGNTDLDFSGLVDDVRIYNRALTSTDVAELDDLSPLVSYPTSMGLDNSREWITNVTLNDINNTTGQESGGYGDYTSLSTTLLQGESATLSVTIDPHTQNYINAWVDWNHDGDFSDLGESYVLAVNTNSAGPHTVEITAPHNAAVGDTVMRISLADDAAPTANTFHQSGEVEDYTITITENTSVTNNVPGAQNTDQDTSIIFNASNGNLISITDDPGTSLVVTLSVDNGTLTLFGTTGLVFEAGANGSASMTVRGTVEDINAALDGTEYIPGAGYTGSDTFTINTATEEIYRLNVEPTLLGYYEFNSTDPGNDSSPGGANDGTLMNGATVVSDPERGDVISLDGADDHLEITGQFGQPTSLTMAAWVNIDAGDVGDIISLGDNILLRIGATNNELGLAFHTASGWHWVDSGINITGTGWRHIAATFDDTNNEQILYLDGIEVARLTVTESLDYISSLDTFIGANPSGSWNISGMIDEARIYNNALTASDIANLASAPAQPTDTDTVTITVSAANTAPVITSDGGGNTAAINVAENTTAVTTVTATDADLDTVAYTISGGDDAALFSIDAISGVLTFNSAPDFESPADFNGDNVYEVTVQADDGNGGTDTQAISVTVLDAANITSNLVAHYEFEEGSGTTATDSTVYNNDGTLLDGATHTTGVVGSGAVDLSGDFDRIEAADAPQTDFGSGDFTVSFWLNSTQSGSIARLVGDADGVSDGWVFYTSGAGEINLDVYSNGQTVTLTANGVFDGDWHHITAVRNGSDFLLYIDGVLIDSTTNALVTSVDNNVNLSIGASTPTTNDYDGLIDDVRLYDRALYDDDVVTLHDLGNNAPVNTVPGAQVALEDTPLAISGISVNDTDDNLSTVQLSVDNGVLSITLSGSATISAGANDSGTFTLSGTQADINASLASLIYQGNPNYVGSDTLTVLSTDTNTATDSDTVAITVNQDNDAPVVTTSGGSTAYSEQSTALVIDNAITLVDPDGFDGTNPSDQYVAVIQITSNYTADDILSFTDTAKIQGNLVGDTLTLTVIGGQTATIAEFEAALQSVTFYNGSDNPNELNRTITFSFDDGVDSSNLATKTVTVEAANDDPSNTGSLPTDVTVTEDTSSFIDLSSVVLADPDHNNQLVTVTLTTSTGGNLWSSSDFDVIVFGSGTGTLTLQGGINDLNNFFSSSTRFSYLHGTTHTNGDNADTITLTINDGGNTGTGGGTNINLGTVNVDITAVNDAPQGADKTVTTNEDTDYVFTVADFGFTDANDSPTNNLLNVIIESAPANGTLYVDADGDGEITFSEAIFSTDTVSVADITAGKLKFKPAADANGASYDNFTFQVQDDGGTANGGVDTDQSPNIITIDVTAVNDAPVLPSAGGMFLTTITEDDLTNNGNLISEIIASVGGDAITDADDGALEGIAITSLDSSNGIWQYNTGSGWTDVGSVSFSESLLLRDTDRLRFVPDGENADTAFVTFSAWDQTSGTAGSKVDTSVYDPTGAYSFALETASISVTAINDTPTVSTPGTLNTTEQMNLVLDGTGISIGDVDSGETIISVTLSVDYGIVAGGIGDSGVSISNGGTSSMTITGTVTQINNLLAGSTSGFIWYQNNGDTPPASATLTVTVNDQGNTGVDPGLTGDAFSEEASSTTTINITAVNDAPTGTITIDNTSPAEGNLLTASNTLADADGLGTITYTWKAGGNVVGTGATYTTTQSDVGKVITVEASYTDGEGTAEVVSSAATDPVTNVDQAAVITGNTSYNGNEGDTATGDLNATDADGLTDTTYFTISAQGTNGTATINAETGAWTFTPTDANWFGSDSFEVTVTDDLGGTTTQTITITLTSVDDPVVIGGDTSGTGDEDTLISGTLTAVDSADGLTDGTIFTISSDGTNGTASIDPATGAWTYTPSANYNGSDSFEVTITDDDGYTATQVISITVNPVTDLSATDDSFNVDEDTLLNGNVSLNDSTTSGGALSFALATDVSNGSLTLNGDGSFSYTPSANYNGADSFTYTVTDVASGESDTRTVTLTINAVNDAPTGTITIDNTSPAEGDLLTASNTLADADGLGTITYTWKAGGNVVGTGATYTTTQSDVGKVITVEASYTDGEGTAEVVSSAATDPVTNVDQAAVITGNTSYNGNEGDTATGDLNATDADGLTDTTYFTISAQGTNGTATINAETGAWTFTPTDANWFGSDSFEVTVTDDLGGTTTQTITITLTSVDDPVVIGGDTSGTGDEDTLISGTLTAVDSADGLTDGTIFTISSDGTNGTASIDPATGAWTYTPSANYNGSDSFEVTITDDDGYTATQVISITVNPVTDLSATDDSFNVDEDTLLNGNVSLNDSTTSGGALSFALATDVSNGSLTLNGDGSFSYTPSANYNGADSFTYTVTDVASGESDTRTVTLTINAVNDAPTGTITIDNTSPAEGDLLTASNTLADADGLGTITYTWKAGGNVVGTGATYTTTQSDVGKVITVEASYTDGEGTAEVVSSAATDPVTNVDQAAVITGNTSYNGNEGDTATGDLNATDADGLTDTTYFTISAQGTNGTATINAETGAWTFTPTDANWFGSDSFEVTVTDDLGGTTTQVITIDLSSTNNTPTTAPVTLAPIAEDSGARIITQAELLTNANDADGDTLTASNLTITSGNGTLVDNGDGTWNYTPALNDDSQVNFDYSITDGTETIAASATMDITPVNDNATGAVSISGVAEEDQTLTAVHTLADPDGMGTINYQWQRDGIDIADANDDTYTLGDDDVGTEITVQASFTDAQGNPEGPFTSAATNSVANINDAPTGDISIDNTSPIAGDTLTVYSTFSDADGISGPINYQWYRDGIAITGETDTTYTLTDSDNGSVITVTASYTDDNGSNESITSAGVTLVAVDQPADNTPVLPVADPTPEPEVLPEQEPAPEEEVATEDDETVGNDTEDNRKSGTTRPTDGEQSGNTTPSIEAESGSETNIEVTEVSEPAEQNVFEEIQALIEAEKSSPIAETNKPATAQLADHLERTNTVRHMNSVLNNHAMWKELNAMREQMDNSANNRGLASDDLVVQVVSGGSVSLVAGLVAYALRGGALLASLLSAMPLWSTYDPLPVLTSSRKKSKDDKEENDAKTSMADKTETLFDN